jgi:hypothetical protein
VLALVLLPSGTGAVAAAVPSTAAAAGASCWAVCKTRSTGMCCVQCEHHCFKQHKVQWKCVVFSASTTVSSETRFNENVMCLVRAPLFKAKQRSMGMWCVQCECRCFKRNKVQWECDVFSASTTVSSETFTGSHQEDCSVVHVRSKILKYTGGHYDMFGVSYRATKRHCGNMSVFDVLCYGRCQ